MNDLAVSNSTCLIALERIGQLELLPRLFSHLMIPPVVGAEFGHSHSWLEIREPQNRSLVAVLRMQVDEGEAEALALALEVPEAELVLDDKKARQLAGRLGLNVIGTIGLLLRAKKMGVVSRIGPLLDALQHVGFRLGEGVLHDALRLAGEG